MNQARVWYALLMHYWIRPSPILSSRALFAPMITTSHVSLLEVDYNMHKSNSTYFADLDVGRSHLVAFLCRAGIATVSNNRISKLIMDPRTGAPATGKPGIMLGAVHSSFKREIAPFARFEMWSRVMAWDRKWLYIVTHFVPAGVAKPTEWFDQGFGSRGLRKRAAAVEAQTTDWESKVFASCVSKYVFKLGRLTIHPAVILDESGLLPQRPGGWLVESADMEPLSNDLTNDHSKWTWQRVEAQRRRGLELAANLQALDGLSALFDGGDHGALAVF